MRILVAWDNAPESDLLGLYLAAGDNETRICLAPSDFHEQLCQADWDAVVLSASFPTVADGFKAFEQVKAQQPGLPVVLACRASEMLQLPRFLNHGLRFYLVRDDAGDFVFLLLSTVESAAEASRADEMRKLAERLREEMDGVRKLQESIIPRGIKPPAGYSIVARYEPSQMTVIGQQPVVMAGGDYYDVFPPDEQSLIVLVGDASGHGLKACMSIMAMHTLVRMFRGDHYRNTAAFVGEINQRLCENSIVQSDGGFITLFYSAIDTVNHRMRWTSAGHPPALLHRLDTNEVTPVGSDDLCGLPLGIYPDVEYSAGVVDVPPNSRVLVFSDGLTDALPTEEGNTQAFGLPGIVAALQASARDPLDKALERLFNASSAFTGATGRHDDTSVVLIERAAHSGPA